jgi:hypothetical protein
MGWRPGPFYAAVVLLLASSAGVLLALERQSRWIAIASVVGMAAAAALFLLSLFPPRRQVDWERIETEQRLWESGPLGKRWLKARKRLYRIWKW